MSEGAPFHHLKAKQEDSCQSLNIRSEAISKLPEAAGVPSKLPSTYGPAERKLEREQQTHMGCEGVRADSRPPGLSWWHGPPAS